LQFLSRKVRFRRAGARRAYNGVRSRVKRLNRVLPEDNAAAGRSPALRI